MSGKMYIGSTQKSMSWQADIDNCSQYSVERVDRTTNATVLQRAPDIGQRIHDLFRMQQYTDVKFVVSCGVKPKPYIVAHKAILAAGSPVFADMLYGNSGQQSQGLELNSEYQINNVSFRAFSSVVEYLYTDDFYFENDSLVMEALAVAKKFQVLPLVSRCESYFESAEITEDIVCSKLEIAMNNKLDTLKRRCIQFIEENTDIVLRSLDFKNSKNTVVTTICKLQKMNLSSEIELFDAVVTWVEAQNTKSSKRTIFEPFLKHIRFLTMSCEDFSRLVQRNPDIFTAEEALNMVMFLSNPDPTKMPTWCNKGTNRCLSRTAPSLRENFKERVLSVRLKPTPKGCLRNLLCILEMKCIRGKQKINALKLSFGEHVSSKSYIGSLVISISVDGNYSFRENMEIRNKAEVIVPFSHRLLASNGNTVYIRAEASAVYHYKFLQFDEEYSFKENSPFVCSLGSIPNDEKLFFISEVIYEILPPRRAPTRERRR